MKPTSPNVYINVIKMFVFYMPSLGVSIRPTVYCTALGQLYIVNMFSIPG